MTNKDHPDVEILRDLAKDFVHDPEVEQATMFRSPGLRVGGKIFAFLGHQERLIVKLPRARALELIASETVTEVTMGARTLREWVAVPLGIDVIAGTDRWRTLAREAYEYVGSLSR